MSYTDYIVPMLTFTERIWEKLSKLIQNEKQKAEHVYSSSLASLLLSPATTFNCNYNCIHVILTKAAWWCVGQHRQSCTYMWCHICDKSWVCHHLICTVGSLIVIINSSSSVSMSSCHRVVRRLNLCTRSKIDSCSSLPPWSPLHAVSMVNINKWLR